jgi:phage shock protein A
VRYLKRWTTGVMSRIDSFVTQVENHEALVNEALKDLQQTTARAQVQLKRVQEDGQRLQRQLAEHREKVQLWRERAKQSVGDDARAVECLRREKSARKSVSELERRIEEHERTEQQLVADVRSLDVRLAKLRDHRNLMRTRQSRAEALGVVRGTTVHLTSDIDEMFDRWEMRVTEAESAGGVHLSTEDSFESEYLSREEEEELRRELDELRGKNDE